METKELPQKSNAQSDSSFNKTRQRIEGVLCVVVGICFFPLFIYGFLFTIAPLFITIKLFGFDPLKRIENTVDFYNWKFGIVFLIVLSIIVITFNHYSPILHNFN